MMVSEKREIGEAVLKMYYVASIEGVQGIDLHNRLDALIESDWMCRGLSWCQERKYITRSHGLTRRGLRYAKRLFEDQEDY